MLIPHFHFEGGESGFHGTSKINFFFVSLLGEAKLTNVQKKLWDYDLLTECFQIFSKVIVVRQSETTKQTRKETPEMEINIEERGHPGPLQGEGKMANKTPASLGLRITAPPKQQSIQIHIQ